MSPKPDKNARVKHFELLLDNIRNGRSKWQSLLSERLKLIRMAMIETTCQNPPTDLNKLAARLGVVAIRSCALPMRGRLTRGSSGLLIEVDERLAYGEQRQVVAHELAHVILEQGRLHVSRTQRNSTSYGSSYAAIEKSCDEGAAEILIPLYWLRDRLRSEAPSLTLLDSVAKETDCPLEYLVQRVHKERIWSCSFALWDLNRNSMKRRSLSSGDLGFSFDTTVEWADPSAVTKCWIDQRPLTVNEEKVWQGRRTRLRIDYLPVDRKRVFAMLVPK